MRKHLTYSNVIATVALFAVLGGTAIAAAIVDEPSDLGKGVVVNKKIKKGTIKKNRLSPKAVKQLKGQKGEKGEKGDQGDTGPSNTISLSDDGANVPQNPTLATEVFAKLDLTADKYMFTAKFNATATDFNGDVTCSVTTPIGTDFTDTHDTTVVNDVQVGVPSLFVLHGVVDRNADNPLDDLQLRCTPDTAQGLNLTNIRFTATEVESLTIQTP